MNKSDIFSRSAASSMDTSSIYRSNSSETDSGANFSDEDDDKSNNDNDNSSISVTSTRMESYTKDGVESNGTQNRNSVASLNVTALRNSDTMGSEFGGGQSSIHSPASSTGFQDIIEEDQDPFSNQQMCLKISL